MAINHTRLSTDELKRYNRQLILSEIGIEGQQRLKSAKVLVIGAGGLACPILQYLVAAGVGTIGIIDDDKVDISNLHRQILYSTIDTGRNKAECAAEKLKVLNPEVRFLTFPVRLDPNNATATIGAFDIILDGSDNFETRYLVNDICVGLAKPLVFGSIFGFEGQLSVFNYQNGPTYRCVFPEPGEAPNCALNGVLGVLPGIIGTYMANEALKLILGIGETLSGRLLVVNVLENTFHSFKVTRVAPISQASTKSTYDAERDKFPQIEFQLSKEQLEVLLEKEEQSILLVDVREPNEFEANNLGGINIPLSEVLDEISTLEADRTVVFYCNTGRRSKQAFDLVKAAGFKGESYWV
ncbi:HesA/MoeB/ThiF family protein [Desertivirga arenae]|uniref:HesA/MoeB/ThiF family protein n=1 Tax=Desertivirga arenae TaxID=2810309 RepID=UPI001A95C653|nr:HesA/MoeB/ThiF family protein [Pedobacter sp. SYSU D00823]